MKYQVDLYYSLSLQVEADSEAEAEEKVAEYMEGDDEEGQGVRLSDMSMEVKKIEKLS